MTEVDLFNAEASHLPVRPKWGTEVSGFYISFWSISVLIKNSLLTRQWAALPTPLDCFQSKVRNDKTNFNQKKIQISLALKGQDSAACSRELQQNEADRWVPGGNQENPFTLAETMKCRGWKNKIQISFKRYSSREIWPNSALHTWVHAHVWAYTPLQLHAFEVSKKIKAPVRFNHTHLHGQTRKNSIWCKKEKHSDVTVTELFTAPGPWAERAVKVCERGAAQRHPQIHELQAKKFNSSVNVQRTFTAVEEAASHTHSFTNTWTYTLMEYKWNTKRSSATDGVSLHPANI